MPVINIVRETDIERTGRVRQVEGMFDLTAEKASSVKWAVELNLPNEWNVGLIVGPSGSGKSTIAQEIFGITPPPSWDEGKSILDGFPSRLTIKEIASLLSAVGFSSPPAWLRPFHVLSNGEQFRVSLARVICENDLSVVDEFTSVVDRTVAKMGSAAVAKATRRTQRKIIAVSCHYDIVDWLDPDWVYEPHINKLTRRLLRSRPTINIDIRRVRRSLWSVFAPHHYMSGSLNNASQCFAGFIEERPVVFAALLHHPHPTNKRIRREHRVVCLPDFQGVGIGVKFSEAMGSLCRALGYDYCSISSHPAMIGYRAASTKWKGRKGGADIFGNTPLAAVLRKKGRNIKIDDTRWKPHEATTRVARMRHRFTYCGPPMDKGAAQALWNGD